MQLESVALSRFQSSINTTIIQRIIVSFLWIRCKILPPGLGEGGKGSVNGLFMATADSVNQDVNLLNSSTDTTGVMAVPPSKT